VRIHHHHSPRHSTRREYNNLSISPVRKHKRRSGVDELQGEMNKIRPPIFDDEHKKDEECRDLSIGNEEIILVAQLFLTSIRKNFHLPTKRKINNVLGPACASTTH
jgi:hypothetical protein